MLMTAPILIVDDDPELLDFLRTALALEGYGVQTAEDGVEALGRIDDEPPALVLLDLQLPRMTGWDVCWRMRRRGLEAPVVFMTADPYARGDVRPWGANGYLGKPFDIEQVFETVQRFLAESSDDEGAPAPASRRTTAPAARRRASG